MLPQLPVCVAFNLMHADAAHAWLLGGCHAPQVGANDAAAASGGPLLASAAHTSLLAALGPREVMGLLLSAAELGMQQSLLSRLARFLQVCVGCWLLQHAPAAAAAACTCC